MTTQEPAPTTPATQETEDRAVAGRSRLMGLSLRDEMDRLWETVMSSSWRPFQSVRQLQLPAIDVFEKDGQIHIRAELPGLTEKDVEVETSADTLTISGEKKQEQETKEENYYRSERSYGRFVRQIALPAGAEVEKATAQMKDGVLQVDVPLKAPTKTNKVEIQSAS